MDAISEVSRRTVRDLLDDMDLRRRSFREGWDRGDRHLAYTLIAVSTILLLGTIIVPLTVRATQPLPPPDAQLYAERYVVALAKVPGAAVPTTEAVQRQFGDDGGAACSTAIPKLHAGLAVKPQARAGVRRASFVEPAALEALRTAMRVYCPQRDAKYGAWLQARRA